MPGAAAGAASGGGGGGGGGLRLWETKAASEQGEACVRVAAAEGARAGVGAGLLGSLATWGALRRFPAFRRFTSVSARVALPFSAAVFSFFLTAEHSLSNCSRQAARARSREE